MKAPQHISVVIQEWQRTYAPFFLVETEKKQTLTRPIRRRKQQKVAQ